MNFSTPPPHPTPSATSILILSPTHSGTTPPSPSQLHLHLRPAPPLTSPPIHQSPSQQQLQTQNGTVGHRPPQLDLELLFLKSTDSYTSLKELLSSSSWPASTPTASDSLPFLRQSHPFSKAMARFRVAADDFDTSSRGF